MRPVIVFDDDDDGMTESFLALAPQVQRLDQAMQTLLRLISEGGSSPSLSNELSSVERAAAEFAREAKAIEVTLQNLETPPNATAAVMKEIADLEQELREKNALIAAIDARFAEWTQSLAQQNKETRLLLDGAEA